LPEDLEVRGSVYDKLAVQRIFHPVERITAILDDDVVLRQGGDDGAGRRYDGAEVMAASGVENAVLIVVRGRRAGETLDQAELGRQEVGQVGVGAVEGEPGVLLGDDGVVLGDDAVLLRNDGVVLVDGAVAPVNGIVVAEADGGQALFAATESDFRMVRRTAYPVVLRAFDIPDAVVIVIIPAPVFLDDVSVGHCGDVVAVVVRPFFIEDRGGGIRDRRTVHRRHPLDVAAVTVDIHVAGAAIAVVAAAVGIGVIALGPAGILGLRGDVGVGAYGRAALRGPADGAPALLGSSL
jgi:hypothetical protein